MKSQSRKWWYRRYTYKSDHWFIDGITYVHAWDERCMYERIHIEGDWQRKSVQGRRTWPLRWMTGAVWLLYYKLQHTLFIYWCIIHYTMHIMHSIIHLCTSLHHIKHHIWRFTRKHKNSSYIYRCCEVTLLVSLLFHLIRNCRFWFCVAFSREYRSVWSIWFSAKNTFQLRRCGPCAYRNISPWGFINKITSFNVS